MSELKITDKFLEHLRVVADTTEMNAGYGGHHHDGGASRMREAICAYTAGRDGKIPSFWVEELKAFTLTQDEEYETYQRLRVKFEK